MIIKDNLKDFVKISCCTNTSPPVFLYRPPIFSGCPSPYHNGFRQPEMLWAALQSCRRIQGDLNHFVERGLAFFRAGELFAHDVVGHGADGGGFCAEFHCHAI